MAEKKPEKKTVLLGAHMSEKAVVLADKSSVYVFDVSKSATKRHVAASVKAEYNVTPVKIRTAAVADKNVVFRGRPGVKHGGKKAYVYLKKGDKIELF